MKKNYKFYLSLLAVPIVSLTLLSLSGGRDGQYSGSPGDGGANCVVCHSPGGNFNTNASISSTIPASGFVSGNTYDVTVSVTSTSSKHGFQLTAEDAADTKVGTFVAGSGSQVVNAGGTHVTHTLSGNQLTSWTFSWTAPETTEGNQVTFYAAVNATNSDSSTTGDEVVTTSAQYAMNTVGIKDYERISFSIYPNPSESYISFMMEELPAENTELIITNYQGQIVKRVTDNFTQIDISSLSKGVYFVQVIAGNKLGFSKFVKS